MQDYFWVSAVVVYRTTNKAGSPYLETKRIPDFALDANQLKITSTEQAEKIARQIIMPVPVDGMVVNLCVLRVHPPKKMEDVLKPDDVFPTEVA